jgi:hypothetical protein
MVEYCPKCNAQLPPGLEKCPRCGKRLHSNSGDQYSGRDIFWLSATTLGIVLIPLIIIIGIGLLCVYLAK